MDQFANFSQLTLHLHSLRDQGTENLLCSDTGAWLFPQPDGSILIPKGCACPDFPVRLVFGDTACVTRLEDKGPVVETTASTFCFPNNEPLSPDNINFKVGPDDTVTIIRGPGKVKQSVCNVQGS